MKSTDAEGIAERSDAAGAATDRRGFFQLLGSAIAWLALRPALAGAAAHAAGIHDSTRNTRWGAIGRALAGLGPQPKTSKSYTGAERVALGSVRRRPGLPVAEAFASPPQPGFADAPLSLPEIGRLLHFTNGVTGKLALDGGMLPLRAAPSAGALYSGELYLVAERVDGLPPGLYYYDVAGHALARLRSGAFLAAVAGAVEHPGLIAGAAAAVLLTNVFHRYVWRYANRGYRYALIDTGHIDENLRLATVSAGLAGRGLPRFQDAALAALLGVDGRKEAVCAVRALGRPGPAAASGPAASRHLVERGPSGSASSPPFEHYHQATALVPRDGPAPKGAAAPVPRTHAPPAGPRMRVERAIERRRSALRLDPEPIPRASLDFVIAASRAHERHEDVDLAVVVHRVAGLAPGLYRVDPSGGQLRLRRGAELAGPLVRVCVGQDKAGQAAVAVATVGRIARAAARGGERSYRDLLIESGAIGQRIYLAAEALGLAARNLAAFEDDALNALLELDGRREVTLHLTVFGPGA